MLTKKQKQLTNNVASIDELRASLGGSKHGAPHLGELAEALCEAYGGPKEFAKHIAALANDPKAPHWIKMRAAGLTLSAVSGATKLGEAETSDYSQLTDAELAAMRQEMQAENVAAMREALGISDSMGEDLAAVVAAWPELSVATRREILAIVNPDL